MILACCWISMRGFIAWKHDACAGWTSSEAMVGSVLLEVTEQHYSIDGCRHMRNSTARRAARAQHMVETGRSRSIARDRLRRLTWGGRGPLRHGGELLGEPSDGWGRLEKLATGGRGGLLSGRLRI